MSVYSDFEVDLTNPNSSWTAIFNKIGKNTKVLDVGCSSGYFARILSEKKDCIVDGIELDEEDARKARNYCRSVVTGNIEDAAFDWSQLDKGYDYILFIDVVEHLTNPSEALKNVSKYLSEKGKIIVSIPNMANGSIRLQLLQGNFDYESEGLLDATHLHYYTGSEIEKVIDKAGLIATAVDFTTFNSTRDTIERVLDRVGLKITDDFVNFINSEDSLVYQYIVEISKSGKRIDIPKGVEAIKPKIDYEKQLYEVQEDSRNLYAEKIQKDTQINELHTQLNEKTTQLKKIEERPFLHLGKRLWRKISRLAKS